MLYKSATPMKLNSGLIARPIILTFSPFACMEEDISALQESLLLYADDVLNTADKNAVESLLNTNASAKSEWNMLKQTKLQPDMAVGFEDKQLLYRNEGGRVVGFKWWRAAAAAVLLGFGLWTGISVYKNNFQKTRSFEGLVKENKIKPGQEKTETHAADQKSTIPDVENTTAENSIASTSQQNNAQQVESVKVKDQNSVASKQNITLQNSSRKKADNNLPEPYFENINNSKTDPDLTAIQVLNTNTADDGENNSRYLNVDGKEKRTTLGGFIRKAKRVLERTANVKTGEEIKIAGFEIALK